MAQQQGCLREDLLISISDDLESSAESKPPPPGISAGHFHGQKYGTAKNSSTRNRGDAYDITDVLDFSNFLPERTRVIFYMSRIEGMTHSEIAEILGISTRAVEKHLQNSVHEYRRHFGISDSHHKPS